MTVSAGMARSGRVTNGGVRAAAIASIGCDGGPTGSARAMLACLGAANRSEAPSATAAAVVVAPTSNARRLSVGERVAGITALI